MEKGKNSSLRRKISKLKDRKYKFLEQQRENRQKKKKKEQDTRDPYIYYNKRLNIHLLEVLEGDIIGEAEKNLKEIQSIIFQIW